MRLPAPFVRLPVEFDAAKLAGEIGQFDESEWRAHPQRFNGNSSLVLVSPRGEDIDGFSAPMRPTPRLARTPYIRQVMASFDTVVGRSRLMRLAPGASVEPHSDTHYFWRDHLRIHIPILTTPDVEFHCGGEQVHMAAGEAWTFDNWRQHAVLNPSGRARIHLVIDTVGSAALWRMMRANGSAVRRIDFDPAADAQPRFEGFAGLPVMPPAELERDLERLVQDIAAESDDAARAKRELEARTADLVHDWRSAWIEQGPTAAGYPQFKKLLDAYRAAVDATGASLLLASNGGSFAHAARYTLDAALTRERFADGGSTSARAAHAAGPPRFDRPVFIVAAPRSGSTLLFETLAVSEELWTVGDESHKQFESIPALRPNKENQSNRLTADHATAEVVAALRNNLAADLVNSDGAPLAGMPAEQKPAALRFLEKTPKNALRIPFLLEAFPDARFIFLWRDARQNLSSLLDSWRSRRYVTYPRLPGWPPDRPWSHLLVPGWQQFIRRPLAEIVAYQWVVTNQAILADLGGLPRERWCAIGYQALLDDTPAELERLCHFAGIDYGARLPDIAGKPLKPSKYTLTPPHADKWRKNAAELEPVLPVTAALMAQLRAL